MKAAVKRNCGHMSEVQLYGTSAERDRKAAWMRTTPCLKCERGEQVSVATEANAGMLALVGSEKQVAWAETIRAKAMSKLKAARADYAAQGAPADQIALFDAAMAKVAAQAIASWWIDHREDGAIALMRAVS